MEATEEAMTARQVNGIPTVGDMVSCFRENRVLLGWSVPQDQLRTLISPAILRAQRMIPERHAEHIEVEAG